MTSVRASITHNTGTSSRIPQQSDAQQDDSLGALHQPALGVESEGLGLRPLVGDQRRGCHHGERQHRHVRRLVPGEIPRDAAKEHGVGDSVDRRIEERPALARRLGCLGQRAVEQVGHGGEDDEDKSEPEVPGPDGERRADPDGEPDNGQVIGRQSGAPQARCRPGGPPSRSACGSCRRTSAPGYCSGLAGCRR